MPDEEMDLEARLDRDLVFPDDEWLDLDEDGDERGDFVCDGDSSLVALALLHHIPLFGDGFTSNQSGFTVRVGQGAFSTVDLSRLSRDISGQQLSWYGEEDLFGQDRPRGRKVAVKHVFRHVQGNDSKAFAEMGKEIRVLGHSYLRNNDNILDIIGLTWDGHSFDSLESGRRRPMLLLEYANCGTLEDFFTLENVDFSWSVKMSILSDIVNGLEALDDAGVLHGDLKMSNVLVFRDGPKSFKAKLCDFGSAVIGTDFDQDQRIRLIAWTPPWDAPESLDDINPDFCYKVDMYCFGLLACRVWLEGGDPFDTWLQNNPLPQTLSKVAQMKEWKQDDQVLKICKYAIRNNGNGIRYSSANLLAIECLLDVTVRTEIDDRADEYWEIKRILDPTLPENPQDRFVELILL
jgi:serine/threonine protein kinase